MKLKVDSKLSYTKFIERVRFYNIVWFLLDIESNYPVYCPSNYAETDVIPFWSDKAYAKQCRRNIDFDVEVDSIGLDVFIKTSLPYFEAQKLLIGPNWNVNLVGEEICPKELKNELTATAT